jgi:hypothetical protein
LSTTARSEEAGSCHHDEEGEEWFPLGGDSFIFAVRHRFPVIDINIREIVRILGEIQAAFMALAQMVPFA